CVSVELKDCPAASSGVLRDVVPAVLITRIELCPVSVRPQLEPLDLDYVLTVVQSETAARCNPEVVAQIDRMAGKCGESITERTSPCVSLLTVGVRDAIIHESNCVVAGRSRCAVDNLASAARIGRRILSPARVRALPATGYRLRECAIAEFVPQDQGLRRWIERRRRRRPRPRRQSRVPRSRSRSRDVRACQSQDQTRDDGWHSKLWNSYGSAHVSLPPRRGSH